MFLDIAQLSGTALEDPTIVYALKMQASAFHSMSSVLHSKVPKMPAGPANCFIFLSCSPFIASSPDS